MSENTIITVFVWVIGTIVSLAVGSGMINGVLSVPGIPLIVTSVAGWVVVIGSLVSLVVSIFERSS